MWTGCDGPFRAQQILAEALGGALSEELEFRDVPRIDVHLLENRDVPPAGGAETPIIATAPAIANAVFAASGVRLRSMPLPGEALRRA